MRRKWEEEINTYNAERRGVFGLYNVQCTSLTTKRFPDNDETMNKFNLHFSILYSPNSVIILKNKWDPLEI